jgi:hypothetical protein
MNVGSRAARWPTAASGLRQRPATAEHDPGEYAFVRYLTIT